jgi:hypothetical protein
MFCPDCKAEYIKGITECADCKVPLVEALPPDDEAAHNPDGKFVEILRTSNVADIALIEATLEPEGIDYFLQGEAMNALRADGPPVILMVNAPDAERAAELVKELNLSFVRYTWGGY